MKKLYMLFMGLFALAMTACSEKELDPVLPGEEAWVAPVLTKGIEKPLVFEADPDDAASIEALKNGKVDFAWTPASFGVPVAIEYVLQVDKKGNKFADAADVVKTTELKASVNTAALNKIILDLGGKKDDMMETEFRVLAQSAGVSFTAQTLSITKPLQVTPTFNVLSIPRYMVGMQHWDAGKATAMEELPGGNYKLYAIMSGEGFKVLAKRGDWGVQWGLTKADKDLGPVASGTLLAKDAQHEPENIQVKKNTAYMVEINTNKLAYKTTEISWAIIGDGAGGWPKDGVPDANVLNVAYEGVATSFSAVVTLKPGEVKFRMNNGWDVNLGGSLDNLTVGGGNIRITEEGKYHVVLKLDPEQGYKAQFIKVAE